MAAADTLSVADREVGIVRLDRVVDDLTRLPFCVKVLLENLLRHRDGGAVDDAAVDALASWGTGPPPDVELPFSPTRILMQDFTGVPAIVDLAAVRDAAVRLGAEATTVDPRIPVELVIDHSIVADVARVPDAFRRNAELELERNRERYAFLKWGQHAFAGLTVVPPNTGICHQVNLEHLARVVMVDDDGLARPDTVLGTDSHTPMVNGLGVLGWGVGGIEAEAAMLGQPVSLPMPQVVGLELVGSLPEGATATDLVLHVTELLRAHGVVGRFVEVFGDGVSAVPLENRATIGNMSPEFGSTCTIWPIDAETLRYLELTGRSPQQVALVEAYARAQGLWFEPGAPSASYTEVLQLDLARVLPSIAGPSRPQDRVDLTRARARVRDAVRDHVDGGAPDDRPPGVPPDVTGTEVDLGSVASFPASDPPAPMAGARPEPADPVDDPAAPVDAGPMPSTPVEVELVTGERVTLDHGALVIAAITSCTNTSNPSVMVGAGLLARNAVARGLRVPPWVKTSLAPGSKVVTDYLARAGLADDLSTLGFDLVGYGCTTCIGNSGPLDPAVSTAVEDHELSVGAVLSGNRNFEGRIHPDVRLNFLASPPLVVAYALAGTLDVDLAHDPLGVDDGGRPVRLADLWPSSHEIQDTVRRTLSSELFDRRYADVLEGDDEWRALPVTGGDRYEWSDGSTYVRRPPFLADVGPEPDELADVEGARVLALLGDSVTTDHISPAGVIATDSPAGRWLVDHGVDPTDFNSYGSRRGNHEVMLRGTFANRRIRNRLVPGREGGFTRHLPSGDELPIYDAAMRYADEGTPLVVVAGREYGSGSSRDWAAKGTLLLGVRAVIAESYERIHRSNLIGMGVLPLQLDGVTLDDLGLTGEEAITIRGVAAAAADAPDGGVEVEADGRPLPVRARLDTALERRTFRHGGILPLVTRDLVRAAG